MHIRSRTVALAILVICASASAQKDCNRSSFGLTPLPDLAGGSYRGQPGGLYPGNSNQIPAPHLAAGFLRAAEITPRLADGTPDANGRVVLLSIGMSNTTQEFSAFVPWSDADPQRESHLRVIDGAQGGQDARVFADPNAAAWSVIDQRLANAGLAPAQVQALWIKEALAAPTSLAWPAHVTELETLLVDVIHNAQTRFPNAKVAFLSSRTFGGYSTNPARTEPLSYETAFAMRGLITRQIAQDPALNHDPNLGPVTAPWLGWGPYLWADGVIPRADGLRWLCEDTVADGVHPSPSGRLNVADLLIAHFRTHPVATPWYLGVARTPSAAFIRSGSGCNGSTGEPLIAARAAPIPGNPTFALQLGGARPLAPASLFLALARGRVLLGREGCDLWFDPSTLIDAFAATTDAAGAALWPSAIPNDPAIAGLVFHAQWAILDPAGSPIPGVGGLSFTSGAFVRIGPR